MSYLKFALDELRQGSQSDISFVDFAIRAEVEQLRARIAECHFWFVAIPRTSSSYIQTSLGAQFGYPHGKQSLTSNNTSAPIVQSALLPPHTPSFIVREILGKELWQACNTFSVVRHPYAWSLSLWRYTKLYHNLGFSDGDFLTFLSELKANIKSPRTQRNCYPSNYCQYDYVVERNSNKFLVKNILKFEDRETINDFLLSVGLKSIPFRAGQMGSDSGDYNLDETEKAAVRKILEQDFDILGY